MRILVICTGNACRSQMAQGFLKSFDKRLEVCSAGTFPGNEVNKRAIRVMAEIGIDISHNYPKPVDLYLNEDWDFLITVCDQANEVCPVFPGKVKHRLHMGYVDPSFLGGTEEFIMGEFHKLREQMRNDLNKLYIEKIKPELYPI
ncbi:MAG: arsenate reductase ArsC [Bacteroidota bacterium]|nr:arsenate reductase ArsC [Bacteroidota bacterium]